ncbi:MAG: D-sedoheptulose 7-phosphate isomerase [Candidatus Marinimicrobia bacterium]|nr:D-sedoheptulose 7-phosphate isomerase [Candidatus Neomarinimicrobiota bacterium]MCK9484486.1 D-sedoheptulose 7-phosphate isomerase [Candidatus Neomarinimicrobiota bacterium]MCK9559912.1 D-sedoheptulose 7-phosphate isomerase [Candidatus Neomarinimicrobiota bacterium]MDD5061088.1 D-sedoheptulose 7-phosphate isomerase [Candidatus Neomarinimicrobiota bacterium]MDD5231234.1 D-sedoheptulose 7-phosphate isomerase [Candidatus Neomarinimicrobiota bacterium]
MRQQIIAQLEESAEVKRQTIATAVDTIETAARMLIDCYQAGGKVLLCGNGGSAADAQHLAAELVSRLKLERPAIAALALTTNTSLLTAIGNDYKFDLVFVRQVEAFGRAGDVLIGISTSGSSENVIKAVEFARMEGIKSIALTGAKGGRLAEKVDLAIKIPSANVQRIQECHITVGHILCDLIESALFGTK